jgi:hypothetical protein
MEDPVLVIDHVQGNVVTLHTADVIEPRLARILEAQRRQAHASGRSSHAGEETFWVDAFPAHLDVTLALRLDLSAGEGRPLRHVKNVIRRDPQGEVVAELSGEITPSPGDSEPETSGEPVLSALVTFEVPGPGTYVIEFHTEDASETVPVHVFEGQMPGTPGDH